MPAYFARGTGHNEQAVYSERPDDWVRNLDRIARKFETARTLVPQPEVDPAPGARVGHRSRTGRRTGARSRAATSWRGRPALDVSYYRLRAYPFTSHLEEFVRAHDRVYVVEQNRDAQMMTLIKAELDPALLTRLRSVLHYSGLPIDARSITDDILAQEGLGGRRTSRGARGANGRATAAAASAIGSE